MRSIVAGVILFSLAVPHGLFADDPQQELTNEQIALVDHIDRELSFDDIKAAVEQATKIQSPAFKKVFDSLLLVKLSRESYANRLICEAALKSKSSDVQQALKRHLLRAFRRKDLQSGYFYLVSFGLRFPDAEVRKSAEDLIDAQIGTGAIDELLDDATVQYLDQRANPEAHQKFIDYLLKGIHQGYFPALNSAVSVQDAEVQKALEVYLEKELSSPAGDFFNDRFRTKAVDYIIQCHSTALKKSLSKAAIKYLQNPPNEGAILPIISKIPDEDVQKAIGDHLVFSFLGGRYLWTSLDKLYAISGKTVCAMLTDGIVDQLSNYNQTPIGAVLEYASTSQDPRIKEAFENYLVARLKFPASDDMYGYASRNKSPKVRKALESYRQEVVQKITSPSTVTLTKVINQLIAFQDFELQRKALDHLADYLNAEGQSVQQRMQTYPLRLLLYGFLDDKIRFSQTDPETQLTAYDLFIHKIFPRFILEVVMQNKEVPESIFTLRREYCSSNQASTPPKIQISKEIGFITTSLLPASGSPATRDFVEKFVAFQMNRHDEAARANFYQDFTEALTLKAPHDPDENFKFAKSLIEFGIVDQKLIDQVFTELSKNPRHQEILASIVLETAFLTPAEVVFVETVLKNPQTINRSEYYRKASLWAANKKDLLPFYLSFNELSESSAERLDRLHAIFQWAQSPDGVDQGIGDSFQNPTQTRIDYLNFLARHMPEFIAAQKDDQFWNPNNSRMRFYFYYKATSDQLIANATKIPDIKDADSVQQSKLAIAELTDAYLFIAYAWTDKETRADDLIHLATSMQNFYDSDSKNLSPNKQLYDAGALVATRLSQHQRLSPEISNKFDNLHSEFQKIAEVAKAD